MRSRKVKYQLLWRAGSLASAEAAANVANSASCYDRVKDVRILSIVKPERKFIQIEFQENDTRSSCAGSLTHLTPFP